MATFSVGVSILLLVDYIKRHGWTYHKKLNKNPIKRSKSSDPVAPQK